MTIQEISDRFDYQFQKSTTGPSLDEYNKSLYLTKAQLAFVNSTLASYEYGDMVRQILNPLIKVANPTAIAGTGPFTGTRFPADPKVLSIVFEVTELIPVIPLDTNKVHMVLSNPFRQPNKNIAYRITYEDTYEIIRYPKSDKYSYIYVLEPGPIILMDLPTHLSIGGIVAETNSVLSEAALSSIIDMAVALALQDIQQLTPSLQEMEARPTAGGVPEPPRKQ